ncbi:dihydrodipicolinate synthase family protein [Arthrobacter sp. zg-Y1110]|uniref:dihydrodipicolinate synthase family protein n=1 Tax=Arthrobacter sp. zg-Y1110 TaxID=2886932 RepID=UPI001D14619C|nr:dihydrodipicolinate synthase family protein [Arthrobacter sp. zg-Y1110]MCC3289845.1 dihydrodipicolinate synthase family protein [Arthrobacter sp. zg-Y1110]UWX84740.1 dihydrodipicolinate synthase family protein [Arthrobacter sp. zg-Y1110]
MFTGLSAFPLTPVINDTVDLDLFAALVHRAVEAGVDSIGALGSTGSYAYLSREERRRVAAAAVQAAGAVPVIVGIGALRTTDVLRGAEDAQNAGAAGLLLAPVSYQPLTEDEVASLFEAVSAASSVPICIYDNPTTTRFTFTDEFYARLGALPQVEAVKIPPRPVDEADRRIREVRAALPDGVALGVSGDEFAAPALLAGADVWFSVLGGTLPDLALAITRAAQAGDAETALRLSAQLAPVWELFRDFGSLRVTSALAAELGLLPVENLPAPLRPLPGDVRRRIGGVLRTLRGSAAG